MINRFKPALIAFMLVFAVAFLVPAVLFPVKATAADSLRLSQSSITMGTDDTVTVSVYLPDGYETGDIDDVNWDVDDDNIADVADYDDTTYDNRVTFEIESYDEEDETTITFTITFEDDEEYDIELDVSVEGGSGGSSDVEVQTNSATDIGADYATLNGEITDDNGLDIEEFGFYYGTDKDEVSDGEDGDADSKEARGDEDDFYLKLDDLDENETYYFMAYAIDEDDDIAYGSVKSFTTKKGVSATPSIFTLGSNLYSLRGSTQVMDVAPYAKNNRTYLPVRYVAYTMGLTDDQIRWSPLVPNTVTLTNGTTTVILNIGSPIMYKNGTHMMMDVAPEVSKYRTCLPIAWVAQAFGYTATWDGALKVTITGGGTAGATGKVTLDDDSITLEPGDDDTVTGTLNAGGREISDVDYDIDGDKVVSVDIDINGDEFDATIEVDNDADNGDECTITFIVTDEDGNEYKVELEVSVEEDSNDELSLSPSEIDMDDDDSTYVKVYLPDGYDTGDVEDVYWDSDDTDVADIDYDEDSWEDYDDYLRMNVISEDVDGDESCTITITVEIDGDTYEIDLKVNVEDVN
ncbi:MAG: copper amine oxidase N-terminal domain-containing protein [Syntrophomonadaceae bacterium]|nr:copper amine oxidase N-terminal domain-containing protein [Syntrophomonadaceae bacterium]